MSIIHELVLNEFYECLLHKIGIIGLYGVPDHVCPSFCFELILYDVETFEQTSDESKYSDCLLGFAVLGPKKSHTSSKFASWAEKIRSFSTYHHFLVNFLRIFVQQVKCHAPWLWKLNPTPHRPFDGA